MRIRLLANSPLGPAGHAVEVDDETGAAYVRRGHAEDVTPPPEPPKPHRKPKPKPEPEPEPEQEPEPEPEQEPEPEGEE